MGTQVTGCSYNFDWLCCLYRYKWKGNRLQICKVPKSCHDTISWCLKITEKVSFNIASEINKKVSIELYSSLWLTRFRLCPLFWLILWNETFLVIFRLCALLLTQRHSYHFLGHLCQCIRWRWSRFRFWNHLPICSPNFGKSQWKTDSILK